MAVLKKIGILSVARVYSLIGAVFGLVFGIIQAAGYGYLSSINSPEIAGLGVSGSEVYWGILTVPVFWGVFSFVLGALTAWLYNVFARWVGGVEIHFDEPEKKLRR
jgi:hypothetical protein